MKSEKFKIHELVPEKMYNRFGESAWRYIDEKLIKSIDLLKEHFPNGTITINNYVFGGNRHWSGLRTIESDYYSSTSMHSFGKAADMVFSEYKTEEVRQYIIDNPDLFPDIKGLELNVSWLHIDVRNEDKLVKFSKG